MVAANSTRATPATPGLTEARLRELAAFDGGDRPVLTLYLDADGRRFPRRADLERIASDALDAAVADPAIGRDARAAVGKDAERLVEHVRNVERAGARGIAAFACGAALFDTIALPVSVRTRAVADRHPHVLRLESLLAKAERFLTLIISRDSCRVFLTRFGVVQERDSIVDEVPSQHSQGGWSQANYQRHIDELAHRHYKHVADEMLALSRKEPFEHVVLAGPDEVVAAFQKCLHVSIAGKLAGRATLGPRATASEVGDATMSVEETLEMHRDAKSVLYILEQFAAQRNAVVGLAPTLDALAAHRVQTLALSDGTVVAGFRCDGCDRLSLESGPCSACEGATSPVVDIHEEMVDGALRNGARVIASQTDRLPDGVGALLRF